MEITASRLTEKNAVRFLSRLFKPDEDFGSPPKLQGGESWFEFTEKYSQYYNWPEGISESTLLLDRINVLGSILDLNHKSWFIPNSTELMEDDRCYFVIADKTISGEDALFLCAAGIYDNGEESKEDMNKVLEGWTSLKWMKELAYPAVFSNSCIMKDGKIFSIAAIQLSSYKHLNKTYGNN